MIVPKAGGTPAGPLPVPRRGPDGSATATPAGQGPLALDIIEYDAAGRLALAGRADPGATLNLYLGDQLIGQVKTGADGKWSSTAERDVAPGLYQLRIDKVQPDGKVAGRLALPIRRAEPLREGGRGDFVVVQPGNSLWRIARHSYGAGIRYALIYTANRDQIGNPALIYPGQIFKLPVVR